MFSVTIRKPSSRLLNHPISMIDISTVYHVTQCQVIRSSKNIYTLRRRTCYMIGRYVFRFGSTTRYCHTSYISVGYNGNAYRAVAQTTLQCVACERTSGSTLGCIMYVNNVIGGVYNFTQTRIHNTVYN